MKWLIFPLRLSIIILMKCENGHFADLLKIVLKKSSGLNLFFLHKIIYNECFKGKYKGNSSKYLIFESAPFHLEPI